MMRAFERREAGSCCVTSNKEVVMGRSRVCRSAMLSAGIATLFVVSAQAQTQTRTTETRQFEVVSVDGNKVVVKGQKGAQEITVPEDFQLTVDGKPVSVRELKPGMKGTARITTTTTTTPVHVTEVRNGEVMRVAGNSIIVRGPNGIRMFSEGDVEKRGVKIMRDGRPLPFTDIRAGDRLTATIVTEGPPQVMTQRQVDAALSSGAAAPATAARTPAAPATAAPGAAAPAPTPTTGATPGRRLPKTASPLPLIGLFGAGSLTVGLLLTALRRRRST